MSELSAGSDVIFRPIPNSSQEVAIDTRAYETLYYGTRGPGKTATQLNFFRQYVGIGYGKYLKGIVFDRQYKSFNDIISQAKKFFLPYGDCVFKSSAIDLKFVWNTGEELLFRHIDKEDQYESLHGSEFCIELWNEVTKYPTAAIYDKMLTLNRSSFVPHLHTPKDANGRYMTPDGKPLPEIPLKVFLTCNPSGPGRPWVKKRFIDPAPVGTLIKKKYKIFNPRMQREEEITRSSIAIFGSYKENIYLTPEYIANIMQAVAEKPYLKKAWLEGSWDGSEGGIIDDIFRTEIHVLKRFSVPEGWSLKRCFDWGSSSPFAVVWIAESDGEEFYDEYDNYHFYPKGTYIVFNEWYGGLSVETNEGLKMSAENVAHGILEREREMLEDGWIETTPEPGAADNQIAHTREIDVETIKKKMEDVGVYWEESIKNKGSRINGLQLIRDRLECSVKKEGPGLYFMDNCRYCLATIPYIPRDNDNLEDADSESNDHLYDALRYGVLEGSQKISKDIKVMQPH